MQEWDASASQTTILSVDGAAACTNGSDMKSIFTWGEMA
jgi:hypothetical protein